jgi:hypothetical protein
MRVCIVGASGKLGQCMVQHALDRGYEVVGVCREESVGKLDAFKGRITLVPGATNDREVIKRAVSECDGVLVVLVPRGVHGYSTGTAQAVLDHSPPGARLVFSCGWRWTVVRGSHVDEGESQGLPVWSRHVGDPIIKSNLTRRVDFALFLVGALEDDELIHEAPAIVGRQTLSALTHAASGMNASDGGGPMNRVLGNDPEGAGLPP